jgi:hypothetical protein
VSRTDELVSEHHIVRQYIIYLGMQGEKHRVIRYAETGKFKITADMSISSIYFKVFKLLLPYL